ncbi:hypothetical protein SCUCBS95973_005442 [Sporothrix curviconia]|uniref:Uncharacterized protein n=1 Tax=Sporothrix curviconia TaxID=1260050 RepID=A0ABP0BXW4_9PEZI
MAFNENPFADDASVCLSVSSNLTTETLIEKAASATTTTTTTTTHPLACPIHTPIAMPTSLSKFGSTTAHNGKRSNVEIEEENTSAFIHAVCRLQEASAVAMATCSHLIHKWSGLDAKEAATTAIEAASSIPKHGPLDRRYWAKEISKFMDHDAMILQTLQTTTRTHVLVAGAVAGTALHVREHAVKRENLLPLSALQPESSAGAAALAPVQATLAEYTSGVITCAGSAPFVQNLKNVSPFAKTAANTVSNKQVKMQLRGMETYTGYRRENFILFEDHVARISSGAHTSAGQVQDCIYYAAWQAMVAARRLQELVDTAVVIARGRRPKAAGAMLSLLHRPQSTHVDDIDDDMKLLGEAQAACQQALTANQRVYNTVKYSSLLDSI